MTGGQDFGRRKASLSRVIKSDYPPKSFIFCVENRLISGLLGGVWCSGEQHTFGNAVEGGLVLERSNGDDIAEVHYHTDYECAYAHFHGLVKAYPDSTEIQLSWIDEVDEEWGFQGSYGDEEAIYDQSHPEHPSYESDSD